MEEESLKENGDSLTPIRPEDFAGRGFSVDERVTRVASAPAISVPVISASRSYPLGLFSRFVSPGAARHRHASRAKW